MCRYNTVQFFRRLQLQNVDQTLNSQQTPHISPSRASYGLSVVRILEKNDHVIMVPHWTYTYTYADNDGTNVNINPVDAMAACISRLSAGMLLTAWGQHILLEMGFEILVPFQDIEMAQLYPFYENWIKKLNIYGKSFGRHFHLFCYIQNKCQYMWHEISFSDLMVYINTGIAWLCAFSLLTHSNFKRHIKLAIFFLFYIEGHIKL